MKIIWLLIILFIFLFFILINFTRNKFTNLINLLLTGQRNRVTDVIIKFHQGIGTLEEPAT